MIDTNRRLLISERRGDSNRCISCRGKDDQHVTYASHSSPHTPGVRFLRAVPICDNLSLAPTKSKQASTPGRSLGNQRQTDPVVVLGGLIPPPMRQPWSRGKKFWPNGYIATSAYCVHITSMWSIRSILAHGGSTHWSLTDTGGGYNLRGAGLPHTHSPTFPTSCLHFFLMAPPGLHFNQVLTTKPEF
jgi:hypothetical protein